MASEDNTRRHRLAVLRAVASIPTAPFHEMGVARYVAGYLSALGLAPRRDAWGNLIARYTRGAAQGPPLALVAHMDHPALEMVKGEAGAPAARLRGGVSPACFAGPVPVRFFCREGGEVAGRVIACEQPAPRQVLLRLALDGPAAPGDFGVFDLPDYREEGDLIHLRAADDLVGCAAILLTLEELARRGAEADVLGVFTRAEEVGLVGAALLAQSGELPRDAAVVSLETSRELPGAAMGQGPVIRVGDRVRTFDADAEAVLHAARARLQAAQPGARVQRQLMSGGVCEATAFCLAGYRATGVAIPLGNYHNMGPGDTIAAEYVSAPDFLTEVDLLAAAAEVAGRPTDPLRARYRDVPAEAQERLAATAGLF